MIICAGVWAAHAAPTVLFYASQPVHPNETVFLQGGADLSIVDTVRLCSSAGCVDVPPNSSSTTSLVAVIPSDTPLDVYNVAVCTEESCSDSVFVNSPRVAWMQANVRSTAASPGGWVRLFGTGLAFDALSRCTPTLGGAASDTSVRLEPISGGPALLLPVTAATCYAVTAAIPPGTPLGDYLVQVNNGLPSCAWTNATETPGARAVLTVTAAVQWPTEVFDVGVLGVWGAIAAAANNSGGIVRFPRGSYSFNANQTLNAIPPFTQVRRPVCCQDRGA